MTISALRRESGFTAVEWTLGIGVIILPLLVAVMSIAPMLDRLSTARTMAQEAARAMVLAGDWAGGEEHAVALARQIARNHGIADAEWCEGAADDDCLSMEITGTTPGLLGRGEEVYVTVRIPTPAVAIPFTDGVGAVTLQGTHTERVDDYRSFPPGGATP